MYNEILGVIQVRQKDNPLLFDSFCDIGNIADEIIVVDNENILVKNEKRMLEDLFDAEITQKEVSEIDYSEYNPNWIFTCFSDEIPSKRFNYMRFSLCANPFINGWTSIFKFFWDDVRYIRTDMPWLTVHYPIMYRYIPELDYKWGNGAVPINQPGPFEDSMLTMYSSRFITEELRQKEYSKFIIRKGNYSLNEVRLFESLIDVELAITMAVD